MMICAGLLLAGCGNREAGALAILWIGEEEALAAGRQGRGQALEPVAAHVRAATMSGLVALDERAEVIPDLAERWIITDDGLSFIFRLREGSWPDGRPLTSQSAKLALQQAIRALRGTALGLDLAQIREIRAMTGRVIEVRLSAPLPDLLRLLAQPELALTHGEQESGPMEMERQAGVPGLLTLRHRPPEQRGLPAEPDWGRRVREIRLRIVSARRAVDWFDEGVAGLVMGGKIAHLPLVETGPLSRGTVRVEATIGLFGLRVRAERGLLAEPPLREALAMALDRQALLAPFNLGGWMRTTRVVSPLLPNDPGLVAERWSDRTIEERRALARARLAAFAAARRPPGSPPGSPPGRDNPLRLTLALGEGPGLALLHQELAAQWALVGVELERVADAGAADLVLVDEVARYADPLWFLNQFACSLQQGVCDASADALLASARAAHDPAQRAVLLAQAEVALHGANLYIPIGMPLRWSLVRGDVTGFVPNLYAFHPLPPMALRPAPRIQ